MSLAFRRIGSVTLVLHDIERQKYFLYTYTFKRIFAKLAGIQDRCNILDEFKFQLDWIIHFSVTRPWALEKFLKDCNGTMVSPF